MYKGVNGARDLSVQNWACGSLVIAHRVIISDKIAPIAGALECVARRTSLLQSKQAIRRDGHVDATAGTKLGLGNNVPTRLTQAMALAALHNLGPVVLCADGATVGIYLNPGRRSLIG